jgi:hypothetical protein
MDGAGGASVLGEGHVMLQGHYTDLPNEPVDPAGLPQLERGQ